MLEDENDPPTFRVKRWSDVVAIATLLVMAIAGLAWGLKLEGRIDQTGATAALLLDRVARTETAISAGTLPLTAQRLSEQQRRIDDLESQVRDLRAKDADLLDRLIRHETGHH